VQIELHSTRTRAQDFNLLQLETLVHAAVSLPAPVLRSIPNLQATDWDVVRTNLLSACNGGALPGFNLKDSVVQLTSWLRIPSEFMGSEKLKGLDLSVLSTINTNHWCLISLIYLLHLLLHGREDNCSPLRVPAANIDCQSTVEFDNKFDVDSFPDCVIPFLKDLEELMVPGQPKEPLLPFDYGDQIRAKDIQTLVGQGPGVQFIEVQYQESTDGSLSKRLKELTRDDAQRIITVVCTLPSITKDGIKWKNVDVMESGGELKRYLERLFELAPTLSFYWEEKGEKGMSEQEKDRDKAVVWVQVRHAKLSDKLKKAGGKVGKHMSGHIISIDTSNLDSVSATIKDKGFRIGILMMYQRIYTDYDNPWANAIMFFVVGGNVVFVDGTSLNVSSSFEETARSVHPELFQAHHNQILVFPLKNDILAAVANDSKSMAAVVPANKRQKLKSVMK
jgi:hypothetical protein